MIKIKRALLSVSDKTGLAGFGRALAEAGAEIISTGGTAKALREAGLRVMDVAEVTGFPEMLDGRVKTLHPKIHGGILARRDSEDHLAQIKSAGIAPIDLVVVNLYPFQQTVARQDCALEDAIENIDIGGPCLIRAAAKNFSGVAVVVDPDDYAGLITEIKDTGGLSRHTRWRLARKAFAVTAGYDKAIASTLPRWNHQEGQ